MSTEIQFSILNSKINWDLWLAECGIINRALLVGNLGHVDFFIVHINCIIMDSLLLCSMP